MRKAFTAKPPRLAVLSTDSLHYYKPIGPHACPTDLGLCGVITSTPSFGIANASEVGSTATYNASSAHGLVAGDVVVVSGMNRAPYNGRFTVTSAPSSTQFKVTLSVTGVLGGAGGNGTENGSIMENYLANAGLNFQNAQGCPAGGTNVGNIAICPNSGAAGQIFDIIDFQDIVAGNAANGLGLFTKDSGVPRYTMLWSPHWVTTASTTSGPLAVENTAMANINTFLNGQTGLLAECAAISSFEGAYQGGSKDLVTGGLQLQTCVNDGTGNCSVGATSWGMDRGPSSLPTGTLHNCTDPAGGGGNCVKYGAPTDEFVQVADYLWDTNGGHVTGFQPAAATTSMFKPGVTPLISAYTGGGSNLRGHYASRNIKDNTPGKANVLYLGGHDQSGNVAGTKLALETLLLLGSPTIVPAPTIFETSRSSPIATTLPNGDAVVVSGTFENVVPAPILPNAVLNTSADFANGIWSFPAVKGHLHATVAGTIGTSETTIGTGSTDFDGALNIPTPNNAGCGTNFNLSCRSVFTTIAPTVLGVALHPAVTFVTDSQAANLGPALVSGTALVAADYTNMIHRVLAGSWNGTSYVPALGGIDHSTVAVIGPSTLANGGRATMAYIGASDGMLHAFCAEQNAAKGCGTIGGELWAFLPRTQLAGIHSNKAVIQGSPHVIDSFGDFSGSGTKSFRTILTFLTGSGDPTDPAASQPALYALDITDPQNPKVVFEYTIQSPGALRGADVIGSGLALTAGPINVGGISRNLVFAETNDGGTNGAADSSTANLVFGIDLETGITVWTFKSNYAPTRSGGALIPRSGVPGGAVGVDKQGQGFITDVVFGDLFGRVWELDAATGISRYLPNKPLFSFQTDFHPIGVVPAIYSIGGQDFAVVTTGGYYDPKDLTSWATGAVSPQAVLAIALNAPTADVTLSEVSPVADIPIKFNLAAGERGFAQATVVGGELFISTDNSDVNASGYGTTGSTGHVYTSDLTSSFTVVSVRGGASSLATAGLNIYSASSNKQQQLGNADNIASTGKVDTAGQPKIARVLWLRTQ